MLSDVHQVSEVESASRTLDVIQIPALLCRQTDLVVAAAETGKPLSVRSGAPARESTQLFTGRTAKELCIKIFEDKDNPCPITYLDHAAYLGREFVRAEIALLNGTEYVQD